MEEKERLAKFQAEIHNKEYQNAKANGLCEDNIEPIYDGICDINAYADSPIKTMWLLKEAWEKGENGMPGEGGWCIWEPWSNPVEMNDTWKTMMYVMYGIKTGVPYSQMPDVNDEMLNLLKASAYVNINKMPAHTTSKDMKPSYNLWRNIIMEQIENYNPDVIIFGNTFDGLFDKEDMAKKSLNIANIGTPGIVGAYLSNGKLLVDAWHPSSFRMASKPNITTEVYVNTIVKAVRGYNSEL